MMGKETEPVYNGGGEDQPGTGVLGREEQMEDLNQVAGDMSFNFCCGSPSVAGAERLEKQKTSLSSDQEDKPCTYKTIKDKGQTGLFIISAKQ